MIEHLETGDNEVVIVDTDAGIEHFGRGVERGCTIILVIVDPSFESLMLAKKMLTNRSLSFSIKWAMKVSRLCLHPWSERKLRGLFR